MFTGIIEETGRIKRIVPQKSSIRLIIEAKKCGRGVKVGDSLAVNGCCLTVAGRQPDRPHTLLRFDLLQETWDRTNFKSSQAGDLVNLERALPAQGRLGGHFVTGHIDGTGRITEWRRVERDHLLEIEAPADVLRYLVNKGSIAVDGISLTVAGLRRKTFQLWIIPHTYQLTTLRERAVGDTLNLETDLLGKYAEKFLTSWKRR